MVMKVAEQLLRELNTEEDKEKGVTIVLDPDIADLVRRYRGRRSMKGTVAVLVRIAHQYLQEAQGQQRQNLSQSGAQPKTQETGKGRQG